MLCPFQTIAFNQSTTEICPSHLMHHHPVRHHSPPPHPVLPNLPSPQHLLKNQKMKQLYIHKMMKQPKNESCGFNIFGQFCIVCFWGQLKYFICWAFPHCYFCCLHCVCAINIFNCALNGFEYLTFWVRAVFFKYVSY